MTMPMSITGNIRDFERTLSSYLFPMHLELADPASSFRFRMLSRNIGCLKLAQIYANAPVRAQRNRRAEHTGQLGYRVQLVEHGETIQHLQDGSVRCHSSSLFLTDGSCETDSEQVGRALVLHVNVPRDVLHMYAPNVRGRPPQVIDASRGAALILRNMIRGLWGQAGFLPPNDLGTVVASVAQMVNVAFSDLSDSSYIDQDRNMFRHRLAQVIMENFWNGDYTVNDAATDLKMSTRYLQTQAKAAGTSFRSLLLEQRLCASYNALSNHLLRDRSITEIAFACGFNELSYFSRAFSSKYGASPRSFRQRYMSEE